MMLTEEHFAMLAKYRVTAMGEKLREIIEDPSYDKMTFEEKIEAMIEAEAEARYNRKVEILCRKAGFKQKVGCVNRIDINT